MAISLLKAVLNSMVREDDDYILVCIREGIVVCTILVLCEQIVRQFYICFEHYCLIIISKFELFSFGFRTDKIAVQIFGFQSSW